MTVFEIPRILCLAKKGSYLQISVYWQRLQGNLFLFLKCFSILCLLLLEQTTEQEGLLDSINTACALNTLSHLRSVPASITPFPVFYNLIILPCSPATL